MFNSLLKKKVPGRAESRTLLGAKARELLIATQPRLPHILKSLKFSSLTDYFYPLPSEISVKHSALFKRLFCTFLLGYVKFPIQTGEAQQTFGEEEM